MILYLLQRFFPTYYRNVWNEEFLKQMEVIRIELYAEYPDHKSIVDDRISDAINKHIKK